MAKKDPFLEQLERRRQQHIAASRGHVDKPVTEMDGAELERERQRLELEKMKQEIGYWEERRRANLGTGGVAQGGFGLSSNRSSASLGALLGQLKLTRRRRWR